MWFLTDQKCLILMESAICQFPLLWILLLVVSQERVCSLIVAEWWWRFWVSTGPAPVSPQWEGKGHLLIPGSGLGELKSRLPTWSPLTLQGQMSLPPCEMNPASLTPSQPRGWGTSWQPGRAEMKDPHLAFAGVNQVEPAFSMMFGWKKAIIA